ncbi:MAG: RNA polymerase sigma factor [Haliangium ochraceum]
MQAVPTAQQVGDPCLDGCRAGRPEAIAELFRAHREMVERLVGRLVGPSPDLEDLVQSTFVEVIRNISRFRGEAKPSTWICGIAVHIVQHHLRAGKVRRNVPLELVLGDTLRAQSAVVDPRQNAEQEIDGGKVTAKLYALMDRITAKKRVALLLYVMEDRSVEEIAALMRATQPATRSRLYFARRELRKLIANDSDLRDWARTLFSGRREEAET